MYLSDASVAPEVVDGTPVRASASLQARAAAPPAVRLHEVTVAFGGPHVLDEVSLEVRPGEILAVIGPNGAGKTTLFDVISGVTPVRAGTVDLLGRPVTTSPAWSRAAAGLGRSFQDSRLFPALTVAETLEVACGRWLRLPDPCSAALRLPVRQLGERAAARRADELLGLLGLQRLRYQLVGELSTGQRRLVDIGCVLAHAPKVILLDEPSSGVAQREAEALVPVIKDLRAQLDASLVVVEHDMAIATALADRMVALDLGRVVTEGTADEVLNHQHVVEAYLGRRADDHRPAGTRTVTTQGASNP